MTLTLPGFAGLILTIGVAADANVVIFERIKEEVRAGKIRPRGDRDRLLEGLPHDHRRERRHGDHRARPVRGRDRGVKGFALMLLIGTAISLVTAVAATRAMLGLLAGFRWFDNPRFIGAAHEQHGKLLQIDFMGKRRLWFAISGGDHRSIGVVSIAVQGLNLGIDFKGGSQISVRDAEAARRRRRWPRSRARSARPGRRVQGRGATVPNGQQQLQVVPGADEVDHAGEQSKFTRRLQPSSASRAAGRHESSRRASARQIARTAILAIIVSLLLIAIYITLRFDWKFAVPVLVALAHDILITLGVYSLSRREVTTATVAAVLTVLGYSIYDTIIIFDRIRENIPLMRRASFATIANVSLWETIRRSLATTFITLLPIGSLLIFGGDTLKDFAFALLDRHPLGRLLVDLHRGAAAHDLQGARARVPRGGSAST